MPTLIWKTSPHFFPQAGKQGFKHIHESPPPSPSPSPSLQWWEWRKHTHTVFQFSRMEILYSLEMGRERGRGVDFSHNFVHTFLPAWKTKQTFLTQKFGLISVDSEQLEKSQWNRYICPSFTEPLICFQSRHFLPLVEAQLIGMLIHQLDFTDTIFILLNYVWALYLYLFRRFEILWEWNVVWIMRNFADILQEVWKSLHEILTKFRGEQRTKFCEFRSHYF